MDCILPLLGPGPIWAMCFHLLRCHIPVVLLRLWISHTSADLLEMLRSHASAVLLQPCGCFLQLGPNVTIGKNVVIGPGVRVRESLVLEDALIQVSGQCPLCSLFRL